MAADTWQLERSMFSAWLRESGETNEAAVEHLKNCVHVAIHECLTPKQREYLELYMSGYNGTEIAEMCGVNRSSVSRTISRGLRRLMSHIKYATPRTLKAEGKVRKSLVRLYK